MCPLLPETIQRSRNFSDPGPATTYVNLEGRAVKARVLIPINFKLSH
jgi:hypothetical protein